MHITTLSRSSRGTKVEVTSSLSHYDLFAMSLMNDYNVLCYTEVEVVSGEERGQITNSFGTKVNVKLYVSDYILDSITYFLGYSSWGEVFYKCGMFRSEAEDILSAKRCLYDSLIRSIMAMGPDVVTHIICYRSLITHLDTYFVSPCEDGEELAWIRENILVDDNVSKLIDKLKYDLFGFKQDDGLMGLII